MPIYEYECKKCDTKFETLVLGEEKVECPECGDEKVEKLFSSFGVKSNGLKTTLPQAGGGCGCTPSGCGCS